MCWIITDMLSFNSRPHKEVDLPFLAILYTGCLSIHDLTRRSTSFRRSPTPGIHPFNSRPHKEVDAGSKPGKMQRTAFQFTTSQGGRLGIYLLMLKFLHLSIHDLTRRSTHQYYSDDRARYLSIHDLTRRSTIAPGLFALH